MVSSIVLFILSIWAIFYVGAMLLVPAFILIGAIRMLICWMVKWDSH